MAVNVDSFAMFNKRRDDPVFLEYLLNHHSEIIDQKEGVDKILYSMEISRLLARVAVQERCKANDEKRPRDEKKYVNYHKTALYIARKGIDVGVNMAYDAHARGDDVPDIAFNHYMGWLYVQYSMMLTETHRYFAAMGAIVNAENYLVHDIYKVTAEGHLKEIMEIIKKMPDLGGISFNFSAKQLPTKVEEVLQFLFSDLQDAIIEKKLRILYKVYKEVPNRYRDLFAGYIYNLLAYFLDRYKDDKKFFYNFGEVVTTLHKEYPEKPEKYLDIPDLSMKDAENKESEEEKEYALWVVSGGLALSYLDFVPDLFLRLQYMCDDLVFDFHVPELNIMMEDVMETFAHCRFQVYTATSYVSSIAEVAYSFSPMAKRIFNQELLLDIYPRLYSVLDKISHIVMKSCGITLSPNKDGYLPQPSYNQIVKEIRSHSDGNPYLLTLCEIFDEINPRYIYYKKKDQPFYAMLPEAEDMDRIRHHIVHSGISLTVEDSGKKSNKDICFITEREFAQRCHDLLCLVKEAIMNTCLAVEYRNRQE